jgi:hypothetical protein
MDLSELEREYGEKFTALKTAIRPYYIAKERERLLSFM